MKIALNEKQKAAAEATDKNVLVLAPPGAGKTATIVEHAAYLIEQRKSSPFELCLLTFTRLAAREMRTRLEKRIGRQAHKISISTFHSVGLSLIQRFGELIGLKPGRITVYGEFESSYLLKEIAIEMGIYKKSWKPKKKDIETTFSNYYEKGILPEKDDPAYTIFKTFSARLRENNSLTYNSILTGLKLLLPHIKKYLAWKHIICDEAHDNSTIQWDILKMLQKLLNASLYVIADPDQAIYGWRNADVDYLIRYQDEFTTYHLEINYRSDGHIVEAANNLISHNENRIKKTMRAARQYGEYATVNTVHNMDSRGLARYIKSVIEPNSTNITVLARIHKLLDKLSEELTFEGVDHVKVGGQTALTNSENFRRLHAFLKLIVNPFDNFSFLLIKDIIGLLNIEYLSIRKTATEQGESHFQAWMKLCDNVYTSFFKENSDGRLLKDVWGIHEFDGLTFDISEIGNFLINWVNNNPNATIQDYLDWLVTYDLQDELDENHKGIQLMTVHAAKGLEWSNVIIAGCNEGILPSKQAIAKGDIESETRLFYTAITRAMDNLILAVRPQKTEDANGRIYRNPISRYIEWMKP